MAQASAEKAKRRETQLKEEKKAAERKAKEAAEAAAAEAAPKFKALITRTIEKIGAAK